MTMIAARLDAQTNREFELLAKMQHKTKSQLLKELINRYLQDKNLKTYVKAAQNIAEHEKLHSEEYADIYESRIDWE